MKEIKKILFPVDLTENFQALIPWVVTFVNKFDSALEVLFVTQDLAEFSSFHVPHVNIKSFQEEVMKAAQQKIGQVVAESFKGLPQVEAKVAVGSPADKILEAAQQGKVDLIIMGTHGRKGLERTIFGSVCEKVVRGAACPVLTLNPGKV